MPLPRPAPRRHIHDREIRCRGYQRDDGLWDIEGTLIDTKTYSFANHDRDGVNAGEPIHAMHIRLTVDDSLTVRAVAADTEAGPFSICGNVAPRFDALAGLRIGPGWKKAVLERLGGVKGCTHLTELLLGPLTTVAYQTVSPARRRRETEGAAGRPAILDTCHALAADSPVVKRQWPDHYSGD